MDKQRLIEADFPIRRVSEESVREKNIRHGHISTLHIWWARRPLATSRATALAALLPDDPARREERLRLAALREGMPAALVGDGLGRLEGELWYVHAESGLYAFSNQPNLNRIIVEKEEHVQDDQIGAAIRERLERLAGSELCVTLWPRASQDVPDTKQLKLAVLSPQQARQSSATTAFVEELLGKAGTTFRTYRNALVVLAPDAAEAAARAPAWEF